MQDSTKNKMQELLAAALAKSEEKRQYNKAQFKAVVNAPAPVSPPEPVKPDPVPVVPPAPVVDSVPDPVTAPAPEAIVKPLPDPEIDNLPDLGADILDVLTGLNIAPAGVNAAPYSIKRLPSTLAKPETCVPAPVPVVAPVAAAPAVVVAPAPVVAELQMEKYNEKSFVVRGNTKEHKEELKQLGGIFSPRLSNGVGWVFSLKHWTRVADYIEMIA